MYHGCGVWGSAVEAVYDPIWGIRQCMILSRAMEIYCVSCYTIQLSVDKNNALVGLLRIFDTLK